MEEMNLIANDNASSPISEAFKAIRTSIQFSQIEGKPLKRIMFTSPTANEGKSTVAANMAVVMAQSGKNVVIVDCDLRNPTQHKLFGISKKGVTDCVAMGEVLDSVIQGTRVERVWAVAAGHRVPNPSELLSSERMATLLDELAQRFDCIIVDVPPILPVTDAIIMSSRVDGVVLVVESGKVKPKAYEDALERLKQSQTRILGAILNKINVNDGRYGYGYGYYYYYGSDEEKVKGHSKE